MVPANTNWQITIWDDIFQPFSYVDIIGNPYDFSVWKNFRCQVKSTPNRNQPEGILVAEFKDENLVRTAGGIITFILPKERYQKILGTHRFDVQATHINPNIGDQTLIKGNVTILEEVTRNN